MLGVMKLQLSFHLLLLRILQVCHLPRPLPPPVSNSSWLFTWCQPLYAGCCPVLLYFSCYCVVVLQSLCRVQLFATPWIAARHTSLSFTVSWSWLKLMSIRRRQWHPTPVLLPGKIPWTEEPVRLQSMGSLRVDWATSLSLFTFMHWRRKWQSTPVFLPGEPQGQGSLVGCRLWGCTESDTTEVT